MITHNMDDAIKYGNRLIMLDHGEIAIELNEKEKEGMTVPKLMQLFKERSGKELNNDAMLLS